MVDLVTTLDPGALRAFRETFSGDIVLPEDPGYEAARLVWNGMIDRRPAIVVRPTSSNDVALAVRFGREEDLVIAVRSGGHSIPGFSTCDGGIVIDLSAMRGVSVDPERRIARANGGALLGELDDAAQEFDLACPVGVVSHTGIAGLTLGGGMGRLQRKLGLTIDNLRSVEMVTADGRLVRCSQTENPDLFWAIRGAGANFGVVTSFEFGLHPLGPTINRGFYVYPADRARDLVALFRDLMASAPDDLMAALSFGRALPAEDFPAEVAGQPVAMIGVTHTGSPEAVARDLARLKAFEPPLMGSIDPQSYLATQHEGDEAMAWGHRFYMKSGYLESFPDELVDRIMDHVARAPGDDSVSLWAWGGAIAHVPEDAMAYTGRAAKYWISAETMWDDPTGDDDHITWARATMASIQPHTMTGRYVNDVAEAGMDLGRTIYGDAKYDRLVALKRAWDPDNLFRLNQNIRA